MKGTRKDRVRRSRRLKLLIAGAGATLTVAIAASPANAATYVGALEGPDSHIQLTFTREQGGLYLDVYDWGQVERQCDNGTEWIGVSGGYHPPDGLVRHRKFRIRNTAPQNEYIGLLAGEFNRKRTKITGVLRYRGISSDPNLGVCDTGQVEWTARRTHEMP